MRALAGSADGFVSSDPAVILTGRTDFASQTRRGTLMSTRIGHFQAPSKSENGSPTRPDKSNSRKSPPSLRFVTAKGGGPARLRVCVGVPVVNGRRRRRSGRLLRPTWLSPCCRLTGLLIGLGRVASRNECRQGTNEKTHTLVL